MVSFAGQTGEYTSYDHAVGKSGNDVQKPKINGSRHTPEY